MENNKLEDSFKKIMSKSLLEIPDRNFEDKVMEKVDFIQSLTQKRSKNLNLSWIFLTISAVLFPVCYISIFKSLNYEFTNTLGANFQNPETIFVPAFILIFAIIILLQIDNLLRLTYRTTIT